MAVFSDALTLRLFCHFIQHIQLSKLADYYKENHNPLCPCYPTDFGCVQNHT